MSKCDPNMTTLAIDIQEDQMLNLTMKFTADSSMADSKKKYQLGGVELMYSPRSDYFPNHPGLSI